MEGGGNVEESLAEEVQVDGSVDESVVWAEGVAEFVGKCFAFEHLVERAGVFAVACVCLFQAGVQPVEGDLDRVLQSCESHLGGGWVGCDLVSGFL